MSAYVIKNDKVLASIFIKRQKAEENNLLSSSAFLICLAKREGSRQGGWLGRAMVQPGCPCTGAGGEVSSRSDTCAAVV